jgi:hypothetical protein
MVSLIPILVSPSAKVLAQEQQWVTYENPYFGIDIQHPSNWEVASSTTDASPPPEGKQKEIVEFKLVSTDNSTNEPSFGAGPRLDGHLTISMQVAESYLDTDTMQVKGASLEDYVVGKKSEIASLSTPTGELDLQVKLLRDNQTTIGGNPAWKIESMTSVLGKQSLYNVDTFIMKDGHLYILEFNTDPLRAPEILPIAQRMIDSFKITTPQALVSTPNATETVDSLSQPSPQFPPISESDIPTDEGRIQDDEDDSETVENDNNDNEE